MKKYFIVVCILLLAAAALWLVGCSKEENATTSATTVVGGANRVAQGAREPNPAGGGGGGGNPGGGQAGTTLSCDVDGGGFPACFNYFDWSCTKTMDAGPLRLCKNECQDVIATVTVTKGAQHFYLNGQICVTNGGSVATSDLKVGAALMYHATGGFVESTCKTSGLESQHPILAAGETYCYAYTINISSGCLLSDNGSYRVDSRITILNHSGSIGTPKGPQCKSNSASLCSPSNDCIDVSDAPGTPVNSLGQPDASSWTVTASTTDNTHLCGDGVIHYTLHVCNVNAPNEETWTVTNTATVGSGPGSSTCSADFGLSTVGCTPPSGCGRTIGFYKTHAVPNLYGHNQDMVSSCLPVSLGDGGAKTVVVTSNTQVVSIMQAGPNSNGIVKLYKQLLGAKLNIGGCGNTDGSGTDGSCVAATIAAADAFLGTHDAGDWGSLNGGDRNNVLNWMSTLDQYNNGLLCAPHCD